MRFTEHTHCMDLVAPLSLLPAPPGAGGRSRSRMIIAHSDPCALASICRHFRRLGWDVWGSMGATEARRLAHLYEPAVVILETNLPDQSGWLSCFKIMRDGCCQKVILLASTADQVSHDFAQFVGAATVVGPSAGIDALVDAVYDTALAAVC